MTVKLVVLYTQPADPEAFERHYLSTHMPLAAAMPGLVRAETGRFAAGPAGAQQPYYRSAELWFADQEALTAAFASPEGEATAADYAQIAPEGSIMLVQELDD
ncbi:MAG TPA: EthD family reductase [Streptosporangiaceae bacterium]|nr:EthD family reductase [Streptosporangiaceae bacterium]